MRARLVDADGAAVSTAVGTAEIGREVLRWLGRLGAPAAPPPPAATTAVPPLVGADWLAAHAGDPDMVVLQVGDRPSPPYLPGAAWLDRDADLHRPDSRGVVDAAGFARTLDRLGVGAGSHVVLAGADRPLLAASAYWCFAYHSHPRLSLLDGGVRHWVASGRAAADAPLVRAASTGYRPGATRRDLLVTRDQAMVWFALTELLGLPDVRCYQGAWAEYGSLGDAVTASGASGTSSTA